VVRAKKSFGQNFLIDESVCRHIVDRFVEDNPCDQVLEVGPGRGAITKYLLQQDVFTFKAVEADRDMVHHLQQTFGLGPDQLIQEDFLKLPLDQVYDSDYAVIGNFPYNISSQILFRVDKYKEQIPFVLGMFQLEVAKRLASGPGSKVYGVVSVLLQAAYDIELLFEVPPDSFKPAPKVTSAIISLTRKENYHIPCDPKLFRSIVKGSFNQRRKMLRNTLKPWIKNLALLDSPIMKERPEQLGLEDFYELTNIISNQNI
ncbi:UNVERIFIED_CONTAM: hypothetical protein GTU68_019601, partial [Idotea baltica]|nr:hypothetical protein [Idotea baltica]